VVPQPQQSVIFTVALYMLALVLVQVNLDINTPPLPQYRWPFNSSIFHIISAKLLEDLLDKIFV
jgi:hypothetical protein